MPSHTNAATSGRVASLGDEMILRPLPEKGSGHITPKSPSFRRISGGREESERTIQRRIHQGSPSVASLSNF